MPRSDPPPNQRSKLERNARRSNHGVITRAQVLEAELSKAQIDRRVRRGQWISGPGRRTYILSSHQSDPLAWLRAASQGLEAIAWGHSALALWGLVEHPRIPTLATPHRTRDRRVSLTLRQDLEVLPQTVRCGIPCLQLGVALASAASSTTGPPMTKPVLDELIDEALRQQLTTWPRVYEAFALFAMPSRPGSTLLRVVMQERSNESPPPSTWNREFSLKLVRSGLPRPVSEHRVVQRGELLVAKVDLAYPQERLAIELDTVQSHLNRVAFEADRRRDAMLAQIGWRVARFTWDQYQRDWSFVIKTIQAHLNPGSLSRASKISARKSVDEGRRRA